MHAAADAGERWVPAKAGDLSRRHHHGRRPLAALPCGLFQGAIDAAVPVHALALSYHRGRRRRSEAPAYIDDISLIGLPDQPSCKPAAWSRDVSLAGSFAPPLPDRRHLAHQRPPGHRHGTGPRARCHPGAACTELRSAEQRGKPVSWPRNLSVTKRQSGSNTALLKMQANPREQKENAMQKQLIETAAPP
jgi:hypothetical protein